jgi:acetolactate synthase-1/2/3 large subunit
MRMIKLSDYVIQFFVDRGVCDCFLVSGGGIMHVLDSVGRNEGMRYYCNYHEQACAIAAEGYARVTGRPGLSIGTTGPGAINALSGMTSAWVDSVPLFLIAGQVRTDIMADYSHVRQVGPQEGNVVAMAKPVTKYAVTVKDPRRIRWELECAWHQATTGRPGPVVVELPLDVQGAMIDETALEPYRPAPQPLPGRTKAALGASAVIDAIRAAKRPLFVAGNGVHCAGARHLLYELLDRTGIPIVLPLTAKDLVHETYPLQMGVFGPSGQRRANFAVQNCDLLIGLAAGLNLQKVGFNLAGFAPRARKIFVDVEEGQLTHQALRPDVGIHADIKEFLGEFLAQTHGARLRPQEKWTDACRKWKSRYPIMTSDYYADPGHVNTYAFMEALSNALTSADLVTTGNGTEVASFYQAFQVKQGQRAFNIGWGAMGWDLPVAIGACIASGGRRTICATGDGSVQWNIQELLTIAHHRLPIKIFVANNGGYTCIRGTQNNFFEGRFVGADPASGVANANFEKLAAAYGIAYSRIENNSGLADGVAQAIAGDGPAVCELNVAATQGISPRVSSLRRADGTFESRPIEDMAPFLPREEVYENMHLFDETEARAESELELAAAGSAA